MAVGAQGILASSALFVAMEKGYFEQQKLKLVYQSVASSNDSIPLLATGKFDAANATINAFLANAVNEGIPVRMVAGQASYTKGHGTLGMVVRKELWDNGTIRELKDLKGKRIAVPVVAGGGEMVLDKGLNQVGLTKNDVDLQEMAIANMPAALQNGALDVAVPAEPIVTAMQEQGIGRIMMFSDQMYPNMESTQWLYSPQFADSRGPVAVRFMIALLRGARDFNDAFQKNTNRAEITQILIKNTSVKDPAAYEKMQMPELNANGQLSSQNLQEQVDWLLKWGYIKQPVDITKLSDQKFAEQATAVIGKV